MGVYLQLLDQKKVLHCTLNNLSWILLIVLQDIIHIFCYLISISWWKSVALSIQGHVIAWLHITIHISSTYVNICMNHTMLTFLLTLNWNLTDQSQGWHYFLRDKKNMSLSVSCLLTVLPCKTNSFTVRFKIIRKKAISTSKLYLLNLKENTSTYIHHYHL